MGCDRFFGRTHAPRTRTHTFFQQFLGCSKTEYDVQNQEKTFKKSEGCSKTGKDELKQEKMF